MVGRKEVSLIIEYSLFQGLFCFNDKHFKYAGTRSYYPHGHSNANNIILLSLLPVFLETSFFTIKCIINCQLTLCILLN